MRFFYLTIISSLPGPIPINFTLVSVNCSILSIYFLSVTKIMGGWDILLASVRITSGNCENSEGS